VGVGVEEVTFFAGGRMTADGWRAVIPGCSGSGWMRVWVVQISGSAGLVSSVATTVDEWTVPGGQHHDRRGR
jgi:hypothetical protein